MRPRNDKPTVDCANVHYIKSQLFEIWKKAELERGRSITVTEAVAATGLSRNAVQNLLDGNTARFDAPVIDALCKFFNVPPGPVPFLVFEPESTQEQQ